LLSKICFLVISEAIRSLRSFKMAERTNEGLFLATAKAIMKSSFSLKFEEKGE